MANYKPKLEYLEFDKQFINGPYPVIDTLPSISFDRLIEYCRSCVILWSDHTKGSYYSFSQLTSALQEKPIWSYKRPLEKEEVSAQYGRVYIYKYESCYVLRDNFSNEHYLAKDIRSAFEMAVMIVHFFPDERVHPIISSSEKITPMRRVLTRIDYDVLDGVEQNMVWVQPGKSPMANDRSVSISLADAVSILCGGPPSNKFLSDVASVYPGAFVSVYGAPIVAYNKDTTIIGVAKSLSSLALTLGIDTKEALDNFVKTKTIGEYKIVGGWAYDYLEKETDRVALVDFALSGSSSPSMLEIKIRSLSH